MQIVQPGGNWTNIAGEVGQIPVGSPLRLLNVSSRASAKLNFNMPIIFCVSKLWETVTQAQFRSVLGVFSLHKGRAKLHVILSMSFATTSGFYTKQSQQAGLRHTEKRRFTLSSPAVVSVTAPLPTANISSGKRTFALGTLLGRMQEKLCLVHIFMQTYPLNNSQNNIWTAAHSHLSKFVFSAFCKAVQQQLQQMRTKNGYVRGKHAWKWICKWK